MFSMLLSIFSYFTTNPDSALNTALIAAITSVIVSILSLLSTIIGWIIANRQGRLQYIRDFDVQMFKEILPALYSLASETKRAIDNGWVGTQGEKFNASIKKVEELYYGYSPLIPPSIGKKIISIIDLCRNNDDKSKIDSELNELNKQINQHIDTLVKRPKRFRH